MGGQLDGSRPRVLPLLRGCAPRCCHRIASSTSGLCRLTASAVGRFPCPTGPRLQEKVSAPGAGCNPDVNLASCCHSPPPHPPDTTPPRPTNPPHPLSAALPDPPTAPH